MKIRTGFVSNSSSSSFMIFGREITHDEFINNEFENDVYAIGNYFYLETDDVFVMTDEMKNNFHNGMRLSLYEAYKTYILEDCNPLIKKECLPDEFYIFYIDADYNSTKTLDDFMKRYYGKDGD